MYKLSNKKSVDFLRQQKLQTICFAEYSLYLHFDDEIVITVEGQFQHKAGRGKKQNYSFPIETSCLMRLLGTSSTACFGSPAKAGRTNGRSNSSLSRDIAVNDRKENQSLRRD